MSDLHQYEIRFVERTPDAVHPSLVKLEWAYSAEDALVQFKTRCQAEGRTVSIREIGPVKRAIVYRNTQFMKDAHFHVCRECHKVVPCLGCTDEWTSELNEKCPECKMKTPAAIP